MTEEYVQRKPLEFHDTPECYGKHNPECNECMVCYCEYECRVKIGIK